MPDALLGANPLEHLFLQLAIGVRQLGRPFDDTMFQHLVCLRQGFLGLAALGNIFNNPDNVGIFRIVAIDTPANLTARMRGSETMYVEVDAGGEDATPALRGVPGVVGVNVTSAHNGVVAYEISSERGRDIRRDLARIVVSNNWGLLELRPSRMSLEEIFLSLTTEEKAEEKLEEASNG